MCFLAQLFFLLFFHLRVAVHKNDNDKKRPKQISLIICARNEKSNLEQHLENFLQQDFEDYEVIVVNDRSWDNSIEFLEKMALKYSKLNIVNIIINKRDKLNINSPTI